MKLTFIGAAHEVTGSCYFLEAAGKNILIDCGLEQGPDQFENVELNVNPSTIDMVLLTHAHMDHSGKLPLLYKQGFQGQVFTTAATADLCQVMLRDSAHIQQSEAEWKTRKAMRAGGAPVIPLYDLNDVEGILSCFVRCDYQKQISVAEGIKIRFVDAGHLLGSASIEIWMTEDGITRKIVFSGDIGNTHQPLIKDPQYIAEADYVVMESTYGNRLHEKPKGNYEAELANVLERTFRRGGNVVIPSFAVGRTQEILYFIRKIKQDHMVTQHPEFEVWVDSPLANEATGIFREHMWDDFDEEAGSLLREGINPIGFAGLRISVTSADSIAINHDPNPKVIIASSGMCEAGRVRHHLKHNLWRKDSTILFVGYQAVGTLGRALLEGKTQTKLFGEDVEVNAEICSLPGISGHADAQGLLDWIDGFSEKPKRVFVTHGDEEACDIFTQRLCKEKNLQAYAPYSGTQVDLLSGELLYEAPPIRVEAAEKNKGKIQGSKVYQLLMAAIQRLVKVAASYENGANKDLQRFTKDVDALCDKWKRDTE